MSTKVNKVITRLDADTGEVISSTLRTAEQDEGYKKMIGDAADYEATGYFIRKQCEEYGGFVWLLYNTGEVLDLGLKPADLTRLVFLATYMDYENYLVDSKGEKLVRLNLYHLLGISKGAFSQFFSDLLQLGIITEEGEYGFVRMDSDIFIKGSLKDIDVDKDTIRLYADGIRSLYNKSMPREHKMLSYIFQAIPYMNYTYNMLCYNPGEETLKYIRPLRMTEYCEIIGYDKENARRLKTILKSITVRGEYVFGFVETGAGHSIFINPRVFYAGNRHEEVRVLGKFCEERGT